MKRACEELHLSQPALSAQLRSLEESVGQKLFERRGRNLVLTEVGQITYRYAEEIFSLGRELTNTLKGGMFHRPLRLIVGISEVLPKMVAYNLLEAAYKLPYPVHITCWEGRLERLLGELAVHSLDIVLADTPVPQTVKVQAHSHLLGESSVTLFGSRPLSEKFRKRFPGSLDQAPFLLPTANSTLRRNIDNWFAANKIHPCIVGEFEDGATMKAFGQAGRGIFPGSSVVAKEIARQYRVQPVGTISSIKERFYAISVDRRLKHPAVVAISETAKAEIFG